MRDQELVLRFLALLHEGSNYQPPMVTFLNTYMGKKKEFSDQEAAVMSSEFRGAIDLIREAMGSRAFRPVRALNAAVYDSVMVATATRLANGPVREIHSFREAYGELLNKQDYLDACGRGTAGGERVRKRLDLAKAAFAPVS